MENPGAGEVSRSLKFDLLTQDLEIRNDKSYCVGDKMDRKKIDVPASYCFLSVRSNRSVISVYGHHNVIVVHKNRGQIIVRGDCNTIFVVDSTELGVVRALIGEKNIFNFAPLLRIDQARVELPGAPNFDETLRFLGRLRENPQNQRLLPPILRNRSRSRQNDNRADINIDPMRRAIIFGLSPDDIRYDEQRSGSSRQRPRQIVVNRRNPSQGLRLGLPQGLGGPTGQEEDSQRRVRFEVEADEDTEEDDNFIEEITVVRSNNPVRDTCVICFEQLMRGVPDTCYLECGDWYHKSCIQGVFDRGSNKCPKCRHPTRALSVVI